MTQIRLIGDVHGHMAEYSALIDGCENSIQVGDFGAGFVDLPAMTPTDRFIRGNHDSPEICQNHPNWIADGTFIPEWNMFLCGGARSIDQHRRIEGVSWWRDEELSISELNDMIDKFETIKPRIVITHDCPESIAEHFLNSTKQEMRSRTRDALQTMLDIHQPTLWAFGHWHESFCQAIGNTTFVCLAELEHRDMEI